MTLKQLEDAIAEARRRGAQDHAPVRVDGGAITVASIQFKGSTVVVRTESIQS